MNTAKIEQAQFETKQSNDQLLEAIVETFDAINQDINIVIEQVAFLAFNDSNKSLETTEDFRELMKNRSIEVDPG